MPLREYTHLFAGSLSEPVIRPTSSFGIWAVRAHQSAESTSDLKAIEAITKIECVDLIRRGTLHPSKADLFQVICQNLGIKETAEWLTPSHSGA